MSVARRRTKWVGLAAAGVVALSGCAGLHPGAAAVVEGETISVSELDDVALAICAANTSSSQPGQPTFATRGARASAMQILLETELSKQFGEARGIEPDRQVLAEAVEQNENFTRTLPEDQQDVFRDTIVREFAAGRLILIAAGQEVLGPDAAQDAALATGTRQRAKFVQDLDVEIDPRFGTFEDGQLKGRASSLSVPASDEARSGDRANPADSFVASLPATQQCG